MKIVFMGTPDFAVACLEALLENKQEVIAVFTNKDKPKGRGQQLTAPPVKELAIKNGITVYQPATLKNDEAFDILKELAPDVIVVAAYGKILPTRILELPKHGCVNVHGSVLPKYRGAAPIQQSVLNGDKETGITTMLMNEGLDTGDILLIEKTKIGINETSSELFERLAVIGGSLLVKTLARLEQGDITPVKQNDSEATHAPMLSKEMSGIDFSKNATEVHHLICGLSDWPCAVCYLDGKRLKVYKSEVVEALHAEAECGSICESKSDFVVACGENTAIKLVGVQYEGSKRMDGGAFLRGRRIEGGTVLKGSL